VASVTADGRVPPSAATTGPVPVRGRVIVRVEAEGYTFLLYDEDEEGGVYVVAEGRDLSLVHAPRGTPPGDRR
jgi:hypothetical protein